MSQLTNQQQDEFLELAKNIAYAAGKIIKSNFSLGMSKEWKGDNTPVTDTDYAINKYVIEQINSKYPEHAVIGEEQNFDNDSQFAWVCDPIDGTVPFSHGLPISTFSLALVVDGETEVAVVYDPYMDRLFEATKGRGAKLNSMPISVNTKQDFKGALIDVIPSVGHLSYVNVDGIEAALRNREALVTNLWSVILPTSLVAAGEYSGIVFNCIKCEDAAAVSLIVVEAGGNFTDMHGNPQRYDRRTKGYIASNGLIHKELVLIVAGVIQANENSRN